MNLDQKWTKSQIFLETEHIFDEKTNFRNYKEKHGH
jgi:hypothetical protein